MHYGMHYINQTLSESDWKNIASGFESIWTCRYRLSRARKIIKKTFGILFLRWRIFYKPIKEKPKLVEKIVLAATALHNYLRYTDNAHYTPAGFVDSKDKSGAVIVGQWRKLIDSNLQSLRPIRKSCYAKNILQIR